MLTRYLKKIKNKSVLIITDFPNDVYHGMHLGLFYKNKKNQVYNKSRSFRKCTIKS